METQLHNPDSLHHHPAYSRAVSVKSVGRMHFIAGCTPADENYHPLHKGDVAKQYEAVMSQLAKVLHSCDATFDDVVMRRIYVTDMDDFLTKVLVNAEQKFFWPPHAHPPSTLVEVSRLSNKDFLIEIDLIACTDK